MLGGMSEHQQDENLLPAAPLGDDIALDDPTEDHARANVSVGEVVTEDLDSSHTESRRAPDGGAVGFRVPTEPIAADLDRPTDNLPTI
jgi:hypothetical protein